MKALLLCAALLATASSIALAEPRAPKSAAPAQTPTDGGAGTAASVPAFVIEYQKLPSKETRENGKQAREGDKRFVLKLTPAARQWLAAETARTQSAQPFTAEQALADVRANYAALGALSDADIMAIAFIVMMEATKSAREDLKSIMDGVKLINKQKEGLRKVQDTVNKLNASGTSSTSGSSRTSNAASGPCGTRPCGTSSTVLSPGLLDDNQGFSRQVPAATGTPTPPPSRSFGIR